MNRNIRNLWASALFLPLLVSCGSYDPEAANIGFASSAIANGTVDEDDTYVVGLFARNGGMCSGSLIAPNVVLTARHCVASIESQQNYVICGSSPFGDNFAPSSFGVSTDTSLGYGSRFYGVREVRTPTEGKDTCGYDIALLILNSNVPAHEATPINPRIDSPPEKGDVYTAIGYGMTCDSRNDNCPQGRSGTRRRQDGLEVRCTRGKCGPSSQVKSSEWNGEKDVCSGDSGGPALDSLGRVIGVASRGGGYNGQCISPIYAGVDSWKDLITETVLDAANYGGYTPPKWATTGDSTQDLPPFEPGSRNDGGAGGGSPEPEVDAGEPTEPEDDAGEELDCSSHNDCGEGQLCSAGECVAGCDIGNPCGDGTTCNLETRSCDRVTNADPAGDPIEDGSMSCAMKQSTDPTKPVPWLVGLAMIPALRRLRRLRKP